MKSQLKFTTAFIALLITFSMMLSSCQAIGEIFKAGIWVGIIAVVFVVGIVVWIISAISGRR